MMTPISMASEIVVLLHLLCQLHPLQWAFVYTSCHVVKRWLRAGKVAEMRAAENDCKALLQALLGRAISSFQSTRQRCFERMLRMRLA